MSIGSQSLNEIYYDLLSNSPQTITMDIPSELGTGQISQTKTKHGIILSDWQMQYQADMNVQGINSEEFIQIIFCLKDGVSWQIENEHLTVNIQKNESCVYKGHGKVENILYPKNGDFLFKSIKFPVSYFQRILSDYFEIQETSLYRQKMMNEISKIAVTPAMERILAETRDFVHYRGGLGYLYLDGKMLELLSIYLSEVLELYILPQSGVALSRTEQNAIWEAKRIIDNELSYAPTCEALAKAVHLSLSKLTKGFSNMFGLPIHSYIIDQRLTKAAQLLLESNMNIGEIAFTVGYTKPSNFASAFKKKYGVVPKNYKDAQIITRNKRQ